MCFLFKYMHIGHTLYYSIFIFTCIVTHFKEYQIFFSLLFHNFGFSLLWGGTVFFYVTSIQRNLVCKDDAGQQSNVIQCRPNEPIYSDTDIFVNAFTVVLCWMFMFSICAAPRFNVPEMFVVLRPLYLSLYHVSRNVEGKSYGKDIFSLRTLEVTSIVFLGRKNIPG